VKDVAIVRPEMVADLQRAGVPLQVVGSDSRRSIIVNR
jgi:hypothetical protein